MIIAVSMGCATKEIRLKEEFSEHFDSEYIPLSCPVIVNSVIDTRKDRKSLGSIGTSKVSSEDMVIWVTNGLKAAGLKTKTDPSKERGYLLVDVSLKMAYIKEYPTVKSTHVILGAAFGKNPLTVEYFRGRDTAIFWSNGSDEIQFSFDRALSDAIKNLLMKLASECKKS